LHSSYIFIDLPVGDTVELDFNRNLGGFQLSEWLLGPKSRFFELIQQEGRPVILSSKANIHLILDPTVFNALNPDAAFYVLSGGDITLTIDPADLAYTSETAHILAFFFAAGDIHILSRKPACSYRGIINAGQEIGIQLCSEGAESEPRFLIEKSSKIFELFPQSWFYLNLAPIISYSYLD
jgi:hypothetical protein